MSVDVLTIDGPSGSGKGTVAQAIANQLCWHYLDSGALYRVLGWMSYSEALSWEDEAGICALVGKMDLTFKEGQVWLGGKLIDRHIRTEEGGMRASKVAALQSPGQPYPFQSRLAHQ